MPTIKTYTTQKEKLFSVTDGVAEQMQRISELVVSLIEKEYPRIYGKLNDVDLRSKVPLLSTEINILENKIITTILNNSIYRETIEKYIQAFNKIAELNKKIHLDINKINASDIIKYTTQAQRDKINAVISNLTGREELITRLVQPVKNIISSNIMAGTTITDATKYLKQYIAGNDEVSGKWEQYAGQIARDTINQYDGEINNVIRQEYGMDKLKYVGGLVRDSRWQCIRWTGMGELQYKDLEKEIHLAETQGSGMIPFTTPENFCMNRGGYNCRHQAIPIL